MRYLAIASISFSAAVLCGSCLSDTAAGEVFAIAFFFIGILCGILRRIPYRTQIRCAAFAAAFGLIWFTIYNSKTVEKARELDGQTIPIAVVLTEYPHTGASFASAEGVLAMEGLPSLGIRIYDTTYSISKAVPGQYVFVTARLRSTDVRYGKEYEGDISSGVYLTASGKEAPILGEKTFLLRTVPAYASHLVLQQIDRIFASADRSFIKSLLLGDKTDLYGRPDLAVSMSRSGIMHIVAVSGMHIGFLVGFLWLIFGHSRKSSLISLVIVWFFVFMASSPPSAVRAGVMQTLFLLAPFFRRENDPITSLSAALALLILFNPFSVRSAGLQLSFCAVAGILILAPRIQEFFSDLLGHFSSYTAVRTMIGIVSSSLSVMVFSVPVTALHFSSVQVLSPLTNLIIMWAVSLCFCGALLCVMVSFVFLPAATVLSFPVSALVRYILVTAKAVSTISFASLYTCSDTAVYWVAGTYFLFLLFLLLPVRSGKKVLIPTGISVVSLAALLMLTQMQYNREEGVFSVIDVGQGQSVTVFSGEDTLLIDCGGIFSSENAGDAVGRYLLSRGRKKVDLLVLTHLHDDHVNGIPVLLEYIPVREIVFYAYAPDEDAQLDSVLSAAESHGTKVTAVGREAEASLGKISVKMTTPLDHGDANDLCLFTVVSVGEYDLLITGDAPKEAERRFLSTQTLPKIDLFVAGHHGSKTSTSKELLSAVEGSTAVISTGYNTYGHPSPETLEALYDHHIPFYRTDRDGTVEFTVHGS